MSASARGRAFRVLFVDNHLLAVAKPAGVPTVPDASGDASLLDQAEAWVRSEFGKPGRAFLGVVHRLDRPVSGVVLFARTSKAAARLAKAFREGTAKKTYRGVGEGSPIADSGVLEQWLAKDEAKNRVRAFATARTGAKRAVTAWRVVAREKGRTLYEFAPETGRPHQLRACAAALGTPLLGDLKYGAREPLPDQSIALHALSLEVEHPTRREPIRFTTPAPVTGAWLFGLPQRRGRG
jgi:23S rRNA pseudouridine1911/1915/1917 synthase